MLIFLPITPPSGTAQQRKISFRSGRTYLPKRIKQTQELLINALKPYAPSEPLSGPLLVTQKWFYPVPKSRRRKGMDIFPKTTTGDADNIAKMLNDACTKAAIWEDDRLIYKLTIEKYWVNPEIYPVGIQMIIETYKEKGNSSAYKEVS